MKSRKNSKTEIFWGERIGRLTVRDCTEKEPRIWTVECDCGTMMRLPETVLYKGRIRRCNKTRHRKISPDERKARRIYYNYKNRAIKKGIPFDLVYDAFKLMLTWNCAYCGFKPIGGLDQVFPSEGYTGHNTIPCCWKCNRAKGDMTQQAFLEWIKLIAENMHTSIWGSDHPVSLLLASLERS